LAVRLIDAGTVPCLRSQTVYHALARARTDQTPDTILLVSPAGPYICIGYHQELEKEVDIEYCKSNKIPVVRREVGGGTVYLDNDQLFLQWVFRGERLPWRMERRFEFFAGPLVNTYRAMGIEACFHPVNDIHVAGRKIGGMGAAAIGSAEVMVGSFLFDFDFAVMSRALKVPNEKFRDKAYLSLLEYLTTMKKELGKTPDRGKVREIYIQECEKTLGEPLQDGSFTAEELEIMENLDTKFASDSWLDQKGGLSRAGLKIHSDVWLYETNYKAAGGLIRATLRVRNNRIDDISVSGDFAFHPHSELGQFTKLLLDQQLNYESLFAIIEKFYNEKGIQTPGVQTADWVEALLMHKVSTQQGQESNVYMAR